MVETTLLRVPYLKIHQNFRIFVSTRSRLYRRILAFSRQIRVAHALISMLNLEISGNAKKKKNSELKKKNQQKNLKKHVFLPPKLGFCFDVARRQRVYNPKTNKKHDILQHLRIYRALHAASPSPLCPMSAA